MSASKEDLEAIGDIGPKVAESIVNFFGDDENRQVIREMQEAGLRLPNPEREGERSLPLEGLTFVFTGSLEKWSRKEAQQAVESLGGRATSSVSSETSYVVAGSGAGSKLREARKRGIDVLDENGFERLLQT
jgi:DNA ligase (NAD+)